MTVATEFWQAQQVGGPYFSREESLEALTQRQAMFPDLEKLMPTMLPGRIVLDYGCGPGHDTLLFLKHDAEHVYFADISWTALRTTSDRLKMHEIRHRATAVYAEDRLPQVEYIHCAGVLHHIVNPMATLARLRQIGQEMRVMVYDGERSEHSQSLVPITTWWTPDEFLVLAEKVGWTGEYVGSYPCSSPWRPDCEAACFSLT